MDGVVENCSYIFDTSTIHGGRMQVLQQQKHVIAMDGVYAGFAGAKTCLEQPSR